MNSRLRSLNESKTRFFNNASHEFRTPITLILGPLQDFISQNSEKYSPEEIRKLEIVTRNVSRLQKLVNTMLDFSRIEAGKLDALFQPTDLATLTNDIAVNFREVLEKAGLKFTYKADKSIPPVYVNRDMWEKIVLNLLSNAFKFTHKGKIEITLRSKKKKVQLNVRDTGIGILAKDLSRIFERFVRVERHGGRTCEGSGIGLSLVKELVQLHGGTVKVKSQEGKGSTFTVTIPFGKDHLPPSQVIDLQKDIGNFNRQTYIQEARGWLPESLPPKKKTAEHTVKHTVMVVDDNADMREYLMGILSSTYHVIVLENGQKALHFLHKGFYPDLIVSDVMMPGIDGYDLVSSIKKTPTLCGIPVILLSARTGEDAIIEAMDLGADDYLEKPFSSRELLAFVKVRILMSQRKGS